MKKLVFLVCVLSLVLGNVQIKRQIKPIYKRVKPTYSPTFEPSVKSSNGPGALYRILRLDSDSSPDGHFHYAYETENGIFAEESGELKSISTTDTGAVVVEGSFHYTSPEGYPIQIQYVSDENGYHPSAAIIGGGTTKF